MKKKLLYLITIGFIMLSSCSDDNSNSNLSNGFKVNGIFYETNFAKASCCSSYILTFSSTEDHNLGQFGRFDLNTGGGLGNSIPLSPGTYTVTNNGIDDNIHFDDVTAEDRPLAYVAYSGYGQNGFQSGTVTVNSVTNAGIQITEIDLDYQFNWDDITVIGNYSGTVEPD